MSTGRYAPSPSGRMHLGNLMCCLLAWLSAKSKGGQVLLRIEDLDTQRCPRSYADAIVDDLAWLGLAADGPTPPVYQSDRSEIYQRYFDELSRRGLVYPCFCSRSQLHAASAPHRSDGQVIYAGTCRGLTPAEIAERSKTRAPAWRVQVPDEVIAFEDGHMGHYEENLARDCGDFFLRRADGVFAYQLAVVVDDALMGVDEVVRGSDLLVQHTAPALALPGAGPDSAEILPSAAAFGLRWPPPLKARRRPESREPAGEIHPRGDHRQAGLCLRPASLPRPYNAPGPGPHLRLVTGPEKRHRSAGKSVLIR